MSASRSTIVLAWSAVCAAVWLGWSFLLWTGVDSTSPAYAEEASGAVVGSMCAAGCVGSGWFAGLAVVALVWSVVRR